MIVEKNNCLECSKNIVAGKQMRSAILHAYSVYNSKHPSSAVHITIDIDATGFV